MMKTYGFTKKDANRVADATRRVEHSPLGNRSYRKTKHSKGGGGTSTKFAVITGNTDSNNYTASIYIKPDLTDTSPETGKSVYVMSIAVTLANGSVIPVQSSSITDIDYECTQQLALLEKA